MRLRRRDIRNQCRLPVFPGALAEFEHLPYRRPGAIGGNKERCFEACGLLAIFIDDELDAAGLQLHRVDPCRRHQGDIVAPGQRLP
jgi:hypothetical protein